MATPTAHATTPVVTALSAAIRRNGAALVAAAGRARHGRPGAVHRARVATRRLREALPVAAEAAGLDARTLARDLRKVTRALGPVRELDVARKVLADWAEREGWPAAAVAAVDAHCVRLRDEAGHEVASAFRAIDAKVLGARLAAFAADVERQASGARARAALAGRWRERVRALAGAIAHAGTVYAAQPLHEIRIAAKKLRYAVELGGEPAPARRLKQLQTLLGQLHDAQILQHRIQVVAAETTDQPLVQALGMMDRALEAGCRRWHAQVLKILPTMAGLRQALLQDASSRLGRRDIARPARAGRARAVRRRARVA